VTACTSELAGYRLGELLERLADLYGLGADGRSALAAISAVTRESVPAVCATGDRRFSAINGTGLPVQVSVSLGAPVPALRVVGEVGVPGMAMPERLRATSLRLREVVALLGLCDAAPAVNRAFAQLLPADPGKTLEWTGGIWIGVAATGRGRPRLRLYLNQRWGELPERYARIGRMIADLGPAPLDDWHRLGPSLSAFSVPYGCAIDVGAAGIDGIKAYFACDRPPSGYWPAVLDPLGASADRDAIDDLAGVCDGPLEALAPAALMPSLELAADGDAPTLKVDVSCNHLRASDTQIDARLTSYTAGHGLDPAEYRDVLALVAPYGLDSAGVARIQYLGIRLQHRHRLQFNVYLSPDLAPPPTAP
jgi:hypothetical protein